MRIILKSFLYSFYFMKTSWKNYFPVFLYLLFSQFTVMYTQNIYLVILFFVLYLIISSPIAINIFRNIIMNDDLRNSYNDFFLDDYTKIFINRIFYLLISVVGIYILHIIILSPFFPADISKITSYLYVLFAYMIYIYTRIMFILPGAACGLKKNLKDSYLFSKRRSVKVYLMYLFLIVPYVFLNMVISNYASLGEYKEIFILLLIVIQIFFTIVSTSLVGYIYKNIDTD